MINNTWIKFCTGVLVIFSVLFLYGLISPEIRVSLGITNILTTFVGIFAVGLVLFRQVKQNKILENNTLLKDPTQKTAALFIKVCMVFVAIIVFYLIYLLLTNK